MEDQKKAPLCIDVTRVLSNRNIESNRNCSTFTKILQVFVDCYDFPFGSGRTGRRFNTVGSRGSPYNFQDFSDYISCHSTQF